MVRRGKKRGRDGSAIVGIARKVWPHAILKALAKEYKSYPRHARNRAEFEFWDKVSKSTANLASGMEKWMDEFGEDDE